VGQEISQSHFKTEDFDRFHQKLVAETQHLRQLFEQDAFSNTGLVSGLEIEAWLVDDAMRPAPINEHYLATVNEPLASAELAKFNIELNTHPLPLTGSIFSQLHQQLKSTWQVASSHAESLDSSLLMIGILPTLIPSDLTVKNMSDLNRYRALNRQILATQSKPIHLNITGEEHLDLYHNDIMMESATTSLQLHTKVPLATAHHFYNASIIASAAMVAVCGNAPYLFGKDLWHESRIALFEQAVDIGGYNGAANGPVKRVSFGTDYARQSLMECFEENLQHFPVLLPEDLSDSVENLDHLKLHNGTIWRWNRPLIGNDDNGTPHIRIEHRTPAAGPSLIDTVANAAFYYGLAKNICDHIISEGIPLPFTQARDNFYRAARHGLNSHISWFNDSHHRLYALLLDELIPQSIAGLKSLNIADSDIEHYIGIIKHRVETRQTGSQWQRQFMERNPGDFVGLTRRYLSHQQQDLNVSKW
jgi:hypothetical protein